MTPKIPLVSLQRQYEDIGEELERQVLRVLRSCAYVGGPDVEALEAEFAAYCGSEFGVSVNSGTAALHVALLALGVGPGDEVITASHTFVATVEAIVMVGATPVYVDIDPATYNLDPGGLDKAITQRTRAILPVHLYGHPADMNAIMAIAERSGIAVVEDACQAHGATYRGRRTGSFGAVGCFSFYPSKNLGAAGEGGIAVTDNPDLALHMRQLRDHGQRSRYHHDVLGFNYRLPTIQAAVLRTKLARLDEWNERRRTVASWYNSLLSDVNGITLPVQTTDAAHVYYVYVIRAPRRDELAAYLDSQGITTQVYFPVPVHLQPPYEEYGGGAGSLSHTEAAAHEVLALPLYPELTRDEVEYVCRCVGAFAADGVPSS